MPGGKFAFIAAQQIKVQSHRIAGLRLALDTSIFGNVCLIESGFDLLEKRHVFFRIFIFTENGCCIRHQVCAVGKIRCRNYVFRRFGAYSNPVAVTVGRAQQVFAVLLQILDPLFHRLVMFFDNAFIIINRVNRPRADDTGVTPRSYAAAHSNLVRSHIGKRAFFGLGIFEVHQPLGEERPHIHIIRRRANKNLRIAGPAQSLITLRTVSRYLNKVAPLAPDYVALELINHRIRALKCPRRRRYGVHNNTGNRIKRRPAWIAGYLHISETVKCKARLPNLFAFTR